MAIITKTDQLRGPEYSRYSRVYNAFRRSDHAPTRLLGRIPDTRGWYKNAVAVDIARLHQPVNFACVRQDWIDACVKLRDFVVIDRANMADWVEELDCEDAASLQTIRTAYADRYRLDHPEVETALEHFNWAAVQQVSV